MVPWTYFSRPGRSPDLFAMLYCERLIMIHLSPTKGMQIPHAEREGRSLTLRVRLQWNADSSRGA